MSPARSVNEQAQLHPLSGTVGGLALLNNTILFSSPWILGGAGSTWGKSSTAGQWIQTSILYAISQPVYLVIFLWLGASPWILLLALSPIHLLSTETCRVIDLQSRSQSSPSSDTGKLSEKCEASGGTLAGLDYDGAKSVELALPVQTSAALDAAFLLLAADLTCNPGYQMSSNATYAMPFVGFVACFSARLGVLRLTQYTRRRGLFLALTNISNGLSAVLFCLVCLLNVRTGFGWVLAELTGYPMLQLLLWNPGAAPVIFDNSRLEAVVVYAKSYDENLIPILSCAQIPIYILGYWLLCRAERNNAS